MTQYSTTMDSKITFKEYFPLEIETFDWICNPLNSTSPDFSSKDMQQYTELKCSRNFKFELSIDDLIKFYLNIQLDWLDIAKQAILKILPLAVRNWLLQPRLVENRNYGKYRKNWKQNPKFTFSYQILRLIWSVLAKTIGLVSRITFLSRFLQFIFIYLLSPNNI
jgi:hypothetical protein